MLTTRLRRLSAAGALIIFGYWQLWLLVRFSEFNWFDDPEGRIWGVVDDVYISACFGRSLWNGDGFVWYAGAPRVEGISSPLWAAWLGLLQRAPGFRETDLGLWITATNACLLCAWIWLFAVALRRASGPHYAPAWAMPLGFASLSLPYWTSEGFEVMLIAVLAFAMLALALRPSSTSRSLAIGTLFGLGMFTRMDFVWVAVPALFTLLSTPDRWRRIGFMLAPAIAMIALALIARRLYYGDWLPNTYYLKVSRWPLRARILTGMRQNNGLWPCAIACWLALAVPAMRRRIRAKLAALSGAIAGYALSVAYSISVGGDSWSRGLGYDRHTTVGAALLLWALALVIMNLDVRAPARAAALLWAAALAFIPPWIGPRANAEIHYLTHDHREIREHELDWVRKGLAFRQLSRDGARMALCPAGALVYFSHRGGVDLLGKVEPLVAHLAVSPAPGPNRRCWQRYAGHNKGDDLAVFLRSKPDFSLIAPPAALRGEYVRANYRDFTFNIRRDSALVHWELLTPQP